MYVLVSQHPEVLIPIELVIAQITARNCEDRLFVPFDLSIGLLVIGTCKIIFYVNHQTEPVELLRRKVRSIIGERRFMCFIFDHPMISGHPCDPVIIDPIERNRLRYFRKRSVMTRSNLFLIFDMGSCLILSTKTEDRGARAESG